MSPAGGAGEAAERGTQPLLAQFGHDHGDVLGGQ
jgi:hypothetical protein